MDAIAWARRVGLLRANLREVVPGRVYRSSQLRPAELASAIREKELATVISLRGGGAEEAWFRSATAICDDLGARHAAVRLRASALPRPRVLRRLLWLLDRAQEPLLFYCTHGVDRSGLAAAIYLHAYAGVPLEQALKRELSWRRGHFPWLRGGSMARFFALYRREADGLDLKPWIRRRYPDVYARSKERPGSRRRGGAVR